MTNTLLKLFIPIILGYLLVKTGFLTKDISKHIKELVVRVTVPALVFLAMYRTDLETLGELIPVASSYVVLTAILILVTFLITIRVKDKKLRAGYIIAITWGNYGWMGWAVLKEAMGTDGFTRGVFFVTLWWPVLYLGAFLVSKLCKLGESLEVKKFMVNMLTPTVALAIGVLLNVVGIDLPDSLYSTLDSFANMTTTLILFSVGLTISLKDSVTYIRKALIPILLRPALGVLAGLLTLFIMNITDPVSYRAIGLESAMPVAIFTVVIGDMLGIDNRLMSSILILSTLLSLITIPVSLIIF
jgi:predicted permease